MTSFKILSKSVRLYQKSKSTKRKKRPRVIKKVDWQTGKRKSIRADRKRRAMHPGKRKSASGRIYWETRKNRSDLKRGI